MDKVFVAFITGALVALFSSWVSNLYSERRDKKNEFKKAKQELMEAFMDEVVKFERSGPIEIEGTKVYDVLIKAYTKHCAAVYRFQSNLTGQQFIDFNSVWHQYQYPDNNINSGPFGYYITPNKDGTEKMIKPEFVSHKIKSLLAYANP
jgi:hypothetical protein